MNIESLLAQLVAMHTESENFAGTSQALDFIENYLVQRGMSIQRHLSNQYGSLTASTRGTKTPKVLLAAHVDVVPGDEEAFSMQSHDGKWYGRGVFDMKFAIAAYLHLVDTLQVHLADYDFGIMVTSDEESTGGNGTGFLVDQGYIPKVTILPDGGENWSIEERAKGFWAARVGTNGVTAHGSRPWEGESATHKLLDLLHEIRALFPSHDPHGNTLNIGILSGGEAVNQIPHAAEATLDVRGYDQQEFDQVIEQIHTICAAHRAKLTFIKKGDICQTDLENPFVKRFTQLTAKHTAQPVTGSLSFGGSDAKFFHAVNVPCILISPPAGKRHAVGEWIDAKGVETFYDILLEYIQQVAGPRA